MAREIAPGLHWIQECGSDLHLEVTFDGEPPDWFEPDTATHIGQSAYLLTGEETLLFDTLSPASTDRILDEIDEIVGEGDGTAGDGSGGLDYLVVSHPDVPHAGNAHPILEAHPEAELIAPTYGDDHELYHLEDATRVGEGDSIDLGGLTVDFHEAPFPDAAIHCWMSERETGALFPVDWQGFPHNGTECGQLVSEFDRPMTTERLIQFHGRVLFWLQYVDVAKTVAEIEAVADAFAPEILAPAHGCVIREDATEHLRQTKEVVQWINDEGRVGILG